MALNGSGTLSANSGAAGTNIALEFGWTPPFNLASKTPRSTVPTVGFNLSAFYGKSNAAARTYSTAARSSDSMSSTGVARSNITFQTDGTETHVSGVTVNGPNWTTPTTAGIGNTHWIKIVPDASVLATTGLVANTWTQLSVARPITLTSGVGARSSSGTAYIATDAAGANIVSSFYYFISAEAGVM